MDVLKSSESFRRLLDVRNIDLSEAIAGIYENREELQRLIDTALREIFKRVSEEDYESIEFENPRYTPLINMDDLRSIIIGNSIAIFNPTNWYKILEMLDASSFDNYNLIIKGLCRECRMKNFTYDKNQLRARERGNLLDNFTTIGDTVINHSCICDEKKCSGFEVSLARGHYFCFPNKFGDAIKKLIEDGSDEAVLRMIDLRITTLYDLVEEYTQFILDNNPEYVYRYAEKQIDDLGEKNAFMAKLAKIYTSGKKSIWVVDARGLRRKQEIKYEAPKSIKLLSALRSNRYTLTEEEEKYLEDYGKDYAEKK